MTENRAMEWERLARDAADRIGQRIEQLARRLSPNDYPLSERERLMRNVAVEEILSAIKAACEPSVSTASTEPQE
jgi:hypothetical protein